MDRKNDKTTDSDSPDLNRRRSKLVLRSRQGSSEPTNARRQRSSSNAQESLDQSNRHTRQPSHSSRSSRSYSYSVRMGSDILTASDDDISDDDSERRRRYSDGVYLRRRPSHVEEDVCYPFPSHYKEKHAVGPTADFDVNALREYLAEFPATDSGGGGGASEQITNTIDVPKGSSDNGVQVEANNVTGQSDFKDTKSKVTDSLPDRFVFYSVATGSVKALTLSDLKYENKNLEALLLDGNFWLDITAPTDGDMKAISKIFGIHPLTTEDVLMEESREKCEIFRNYMFVSYRAFNQDHYSVDFLKPINFYNIVFKHGILTFHFEPLPHPHNVRKRAKQLKDFINVTSDWINYAIVDDITDSFAPLIQQIEVEVDSIDDLVLLLRESEQSDMLRRIGSCRKRVMHLLRLLSSKAEVIRGLLKRSEDRLREGPYRLQEPAPGAAIANVGGITNLARSGTATPTQSGVSAGRDGAFRFFPGHEDMLKSEDEARYTNPDVVLYFGDIQDHIITMLQNLNHYETILSRAHSNYLAQISIELTQTSNSFNSNVSRLTVFATVLVPMNIITGLWGMNVRVPGEAFQDLGYFFWIVASLAMFAIFALTVAKRADLL
ncbi:hypothetical protein INT43_008554 [Umbelopsis isabellina]|uniref:Uncharacterized protein n=1 Tax=Mortierella isabellina TaxID=91625 RepID=A0A8H7PVC0_MORIS|nr:hypothetical protein INT43_008554 [Umbelopsis isabellina]